jgi:quinol monooxygenase YgiN
MNSPVTVIARIVAKPGQEGRVRSELRDLLAPTRVEEGCINYDMHESASDPAAFLFHESWRSQGDLDRHFQTPHLQRWLRISEELLAEPLDVSVWRKVD